VPMVLTLKRFHSIAAAKITFANPTFFVGCNGSGKSNLADAFAFISEAVTSPLQLAFDRRGGIEAVTTRIPITGQLHVRRLESPPLGIAIEIHQGEEEDAWPFKFVKYAFEVAPISRVEFEVTREQFILDDLTGNRHWYDRQGLRVRSNIRFMESIDYWSSGTSLIMPLLGGVAPFHRAYNVLQNMRVYAIDPNSLTARGASS
jgi:predicted ATPase